MSYFQATAAARLLGLLERIWGLKVSWEGDEKQPFVKRAPSRKWFCPASGRHPHPLQKVLGRPALSLEGWQGSLGVGGGVLRSWLLASSATKGPACSPPLQGAQQWRVWRWALAELSLPVTAGGS